MTKEAFFQKTDSHFFCTDRKWAAEYCKAYCTEETAHILRVADEVCGKYFLFDLEWDMEPTQEPVIFSDEIDWKFRPGKDMEFTYQFNRHRFFICLGQAYLITGDEKYARCFTELLLHWISHETLSEETRWSTWRSLDTGIRSANWCKALYLFRNSPELSESFLDAVYRSLLQHAQYLLEVRSDYQLMSNWGVMESHGLLLISCMLPQSEQMEYYRSQAVGQLERQIRIQVLGDGVHWEDSPMYHNEVLQCYLDLLILSERNGFSVSGELKERVHRMAMANLWWQKPNHHQFMQGDSDDTDLRGILTEGACIFHDPVLKSAGYEHPDFDTAWNLGKEAATEYEHMTRAAPGQCSVFLEDSGNYYLRTDWTEHAGLLHFDCGTVGAGHGHSDKLHIDLVVNGEDVLVDSGRYSYELSSGRISFKAPSAHNTITVDQQDFIVCKDAWSCTKLSQPVKQGGRLTSSIDFVQGGHLGYMDQADGVFINRKVLFLKPDLYLIADELYTGGEHSYQFYWHFSERGEVSAHENRVSFCGQQAEAEFLFLNPALRLKLEQTEISRIYNRKSRNITAAGQLTAKGFASVLTVINTGPRGGMEPAIIEKVPVRSRLKGTLFTDSQAEAVKIVKGNRAFLAVICHREVITPTDLLSCEGCLGYGNVIVFDLNHGRENGTVLCW